MGKALEDETLIAFAMNGKDIPLAHGFPLRLVAGGWPASVSGKWLKRIAVRDKGAWSQDDGRQLQSAHRACGRHRSARGKATHHREHAGEVLRRLSKSGASLVPGQKLNVRGHAWAGDLCGEGNARLHRLRDDLVQPRSFRRTTGWLGNAGPPN